MVVAAAAAMAAVVVVLLSFFRCFDVSMFRWWWWWSDSDKTNDEIPMQRAETIDKYTERAVETDDYGGQSMGGEYGVRCRG